MAPAVLAMGADRYAIVAEPPLYVLATVILSLASCCRLRRVITPVRERSGVMS
jgi:hypothetical protein